MNEWKEATLNDIGLLQRGKSKHRPRYAFHLYGGPYPFVQTGEIRSARKYIREYDKTYSEEGLKQSKLWKKGTLCITIAANIAEIGILDFDACFPDSVIGFVPDETKADLDFVYYSLQHFQRELKHRGEGSVQDNINLGTFRDMMFPMPEIAEQKAITAVLTPLDNKIDLLHRQNKTLESLAQTLFRHWFIDGAADDWEGVTIGEFTQINTSTIRKDYDQSSIEYLDTGSITEGKIEGYKQYTLEDAPSRAKRLVRHNDVIYSTVRPIQKHYGIIKHPKPNLVVSTGFSVLTCNKIDPHFVYILLTQPDMTEYLHSIAEGSTSTYPSLKPSDLAKVEFQLPPKDKLEDFSKLAHDSWAKIDHNQNQIRTLEKLRDTLLPKLMSGAVRVRL